jgi:hypothetical protein
VNPGMAIFRKYQRFQRGSNDVYRQRSVGTGEASRVIPESPYSMSGQESEFLGAVDELFRLRKEQEELQARLAAQQAAEREADMAMTDAERFKPTDEQRKSAYGTIGVNINDQEFEIPLLYEGMTPEEAEEAARMRLEVGLSPFASDEELEAEQNSLGIGPDDASALENARRLTPELYPGQYAQGTSNVRHLQRGSDEVPSRAHFLPWPQELDDLMLRLLRREIREPYPEDGKRRKFNPRDVPIMDTDPGRAFDPERLGNAFMVQKGTANVRNPGLDLFRKQIRRKKKS